MVRLYGLFMWFVDECLYYCFFFLSTGFPSSKTLSKETLLTWATATVREHFYYDNKTLHAVTSHPFRPVRLAAAVVFRSILTFCVFVARGSVRLRSDHNLRFLFIVPPFISDYVHRVVLGEPLHRSKSIVQS